MTNPLDARWRLAVDVGNSRIKFGLFATTAGPRPPGELPECVRATSVPAGSPLPWRDIRDWLPNGTTFGGVVAGSNPAGVARVTHGWPTDAGPRPVTITDPTSLGLAMTVLEPARVGIDRALTAVAANAVRPAGSSAVIVDTGTATTIDRVSPDGAFEGGAILPGFDLCSRALHLYTALLPEIGIEELAASPREPLGRDTRSALRSGLFWGQLGAVRELVARLSNDGPSLTLLTGGGAAMLAPHLPGVRWERRLALQGLVLSVERT